MFRQMTIYAWARRDHPVRHVVLVDRRGDRALLHLQPGAQAVEAVCAAGGEAPQGRPPEGGDRAVRRRRTSVTATSPRSCSPACRNISSSRKAAAALNREDVLDTVRRSIQRATALTASDLKKGVTRAGDDRFDGAVRRTARHGHRRHQRVRRHRRHRHGQHRRGVGRYRRSARSRPRWGSSSRFPAVWFYNYLTNRLEYFNVEMDNSSSELVDYFIKKTA